MGYTDGLTCEYGRDCLCMDGHRWKCLARTNKVVIHPGNQTAPDLRPSAGEQAYLTPSSVETQGMYAQSGDLRLTRKGPKLLTG